MAHDDPFIRKLLEDAEHYVSGMAPTPGARELRSRLDQYKRAVVGWATRSPSDEQREALREGIQEVLRIAKGTAPTVRMRKRPLSDG